MGSLMTPLAPVKVTLLLTLVMTVAVVGVLAVKMRNYREVDVVYPDMAECHLASLPDHSKLWCGAKCLQHPDCSLFCRIDNMCKLFSTRVSWHYRGLHNNSPTTHCYSSWGSESDAAHSASLNASDPYAHHSIVMNASNAVVGFYCKTDTKFCYMSAGSDRPFWVADLGTARKVSSVRVQTSRRTDQRFEDVEVRVGDNVQDLTQNRLLGRYAGFSSLGEVVTFKAQTFITGSVVSLQSTALNSLSLCDVQILYV